MLPFIGQPCIVLRQIGCLSQSYQTFPQRIFLLWLLLLLLNFISSFRMTLMVISLIGIRFTLVSYSSKPRSSPWFVVTFAAFIACKNYTGISKFNQKIIIDVRSVISILCHNHNSFSIFQEIQLIKESCSLIDQCYCNGEESFLSPSVWLEMSDRVIHFQHH